MAKKKALTKNITSAPTDASADVATIQLAYGDALKNQVIVLINNYIAGTPDPEGKFSAGLAIIRQARDKAIQLAQS